MDKEIKVRNIIAWILLIAGFTMIFVGFLEPWVKQVGFIWGNIFSILATLGWYQMLGWAFKNN